MVVSLTISVSDVVQSVDLQLEVARPGGEVGSALAAAPHGARQADVVHCGDDQQNSYHAGYSSGQSQQNNINSPLI